MQENNKNGKKKITKFKNLKKISVLYSVGKLTFYYYTIHKICTGIGFYQKLLKNTENFTKKHVKHEICNTKKTTKIL